MARRSVRCAKKPLLVVGHGIRLAKAQEELYKVLELGIPCVTTFNGFDLIPNDHPCFVGRIGSLGTYGGNYALNSCDMLICVGTRNNMRQISFDWDSFAPQAQRVIVDIDRNELKKYTSKDVVIHKDAKAFLRDFKKYVDIKIQSGWLKELKDYNEYHPVKLDPPYWFFNNFTSLLPENSVVVCGNATACIGMYQAGIVKKGQRIFWNSGTASMGYDIPASIGAHFATGKEVFCITGDGSLQMNIQELQTINHYKLPIRIIVISNHGYRSIEMTQETYFDGDYIGCNKDSGISFPPLDKIASAYGFTYLSSNKNRIEDVFICTKRCLYDLSIYDNYVFKPKFTKPMEAK